MESYNVSWNLLRTILCNQTIIDELKFDITLEDCSHMTGTFDSGSATQMWKITITAAIIFVIGIVSNIVFLIISGTTKRYHKASWTYVNNLAFADILVLLCMVGFICYVLINPTDHISNFHIYLFPSLDIFLSSASILSVAVIAIDRVFTIRHSGDQLSLSITRNAKPVISLIWAYCLAILILALSRMRVEKNHVFHAAVIWTATVVAFFGGVIVTVICYIAIAFYYVKHTLAANQIASVPRLLKEDSGGMDTAREQKVKQKRVNKAFVAAVTPLPFVLGWSFFLGTQTYELITKDFMTGIHWNNAMIIVPWAVSALNPLIYMLMTSSIRKEVKSALLKHFRCSKQTKLYKSNHSIQLTSII